MKEKTIAGQFIGKIALGLRNLVEIVLPTMAFVVLFLSFVYSIFARYIFNRPPAWGTEVQVASYIWTVLLAACYVRRLDKHVKFTMFYDLFSPKAQRIIRIARNLLMGTTYMILLPYSIRYIVRYRTMSPSFRIPVKYYFAPIIILVFGVMMYSLTDVYKDIKAIIKERGQGVQPTEEGMKK
jgi:TRAP-type C4-dicarboxylate transport system permease small subunit